MTQVQGPVALATELAQRLAPAEAEHDRTGTFPLEHYQLLHEAGYLRLAIPREHGGAGASLLELVQAQEALATHAGAALGVGVGMLWNVVGKLLATRSWPAELVHEVLGRIAREGGLANMVATEPELGSISRGGLPRTTAERVPGGYHIRGHKIFVTAARALRYLITLVQLPPDPAAPSGYVAYAVVEAPAPGLRIEPTWGDSLSQRSGGSDDVYFEDVFVPESHVVERQIVGQQQRSPGPGPYWLSLIAVYLGVGQAALDAAIRYAHERVPSALGHSLAGHEQIQRGIGEAHVTLAAARALLYDAARSCQLQGDALQNAARVAEVKYAVTHAACHATDLALRVAGGFSLTRRLSLERHFRDARAGLFQPLQDDLALALVGRAQLAAAIPALADSAAPDANP